MRGREVVLFAAEPRPMVQASRWIERKIHLGYSRSNERTLETARMMARSAVVFHRRVTAYLERHLASEERSDGFVYGVHRDSLLGHDHIVRHFRRVDAIIRDVLDDADRDYLGERQLEP